MIDEGLLVAAVVLTVHRDLGPNHQDTFATIQAGVQHAQSFEFDRELCTPELYDAACDALEAGLFPLPAEWCYYQWHEEVERGSRPLDIGVLCFRDGGKVLATLVNRTNEGKPGWQSIIEFDEEGPFAPSILQGNGEGQAPEEITMAVLQRVLAFTMALRCRDVIVHDCGPSPAIKRKREKRGLPPIIEFKKITIKPELRGVYETASKDFDRNGPRLHFRRGHIRNLSQGGQTYVSPCWVGNAALGVIEKQYEVKQ